MCVGLLLGLVAETSCIQDLIHLAVYARDGTVAANFRSVLKVFHRNKKQTGVDRMMLSVYTAILWRALKAANPTGACLCACGIPSPSERHFDALCDRSQPVPCRSAQCGGRGAFVGLLMFL